LDQRGQFLERPEVIVRVDGGDAVEMSLDALVGFGLACWLGERKCRHRENEQRASAKKHGGPPKSCPPPYHTPSRSAPKKRLLQGIEIDVEFLHHGLADLPAFFLHL